MPAAVNDEMKSPVTMVRGLSPENRNARVHSKPAEKHTRKRASRAAWSPRKSSLSPRSASATRTRLGSLFSAASSTDCIGGLRRCLHRWVSCFVQPAVVTQNTVYYKRCLPSQNRDASHLHRGPPLLPAPGSVAEEGSKGTVKHRLLENGEREGEAEAQAPQLPAEGLRKENHVVCGEQSV